MDGEMSLGMVLAEMGLAFRANSLDFQVFYLAQICGQCKRAENMAAILNLLSQFVAKVLKE
ncbi:MAG: hypothetical protein IPH31_04585 [Lewinellaceae bacterium]|nr:hypothetical protein [Lewinellaceae bacterium]